jgi:hypothetical protein
LWYTTPPLAYCINIISESQPFLHLLSTEILWQSIALLLSSESRYSTSWYVDY